MHMHQPLGRFINGSALILCVWLSLGKISVGYAQTAQPVPQKVFAAMHTTIKECPDSPIDLRLEVWNVGSAGGSQYSAATITATGYDCINGKSGTELKTSHYEGTFSGGPDGTVKLKMIFTEEEKKYINPEAINHVYVLKFVNGQYVIGEGGDYGGGTGGFLVQNPEAFNGAAAQPQEVTPTPGQSCTPTVSNISGLKPGDILSPVVDFSAPDGKPIAPLSSVWYINGKQTYSTTWDGKETRLELQYTCPDNNAHTQVYTLPAYVPDQAPPAAPPPPDPAANPPADQPPLSQPPADQPPAAPAANSPAGPSSLPPPGNADPTAVIIAAGAVVIGLAGTAGMGGYVLVNILRNPKPVPAAPRPVQTVQTPPPAPFPQPPPAAEKPPVVASPPPRPPARPPHPAEPTPPQPPAQQPGAFEASGQAAKDYADTVSDFSDKVGKAKDLVEGFDGLSHEAKDLIVEKLKKLQESLEKVKEHAEKTSEFFSNIDEFHKQLKELGSQYQEIQDAYTEALENMHGLPEGSAKQMADLTAVIETIGRTTSAALNKIPGANLVNIDQAFDVTKSFSEFSKGLQKWLKVIKTSETEAEGLGGSDGYTPKSNAARDPEFIRWKAKWIKEHPEQPGGMWQWIKEKIWGKKVSAHTKSFR